MENYPSRTCSFVRPYLTVANHRAPHVRCDTLTCVPQDMADSGHLRPRDFWVPSLQVVGQMAAGLRDDFNAAFHEPPLTPVAAKASSVTPVVSLRMCSIASMISVSRGTADATKHSQRRSLDPLPQNRVQACTSHDLCLGAGNPGDELLDIHQPEETELASCVIKRKDRRRSRPAPRHAM